MTLVKRWNTPHVRITWKGDKVAKQLMEASRETTFEVGKRAELLAKVYAHVDEGNMRRATGLVHPLRHEVYHRRGPIWPPPEVVGTIDDVRDLKDGRFTTLISSLVNYAIFEEIVRGHRFIAPAVHEAIQGYEEIARRYVRKGVVG